MLKGKYVKNAALYKISLEGKIVFRAGATSGIESVFERFKVLEAQFSANLGLDDN